MKISDSCYVVQGLSAPAPWMANAGFIVGEKKTLIIDSGFNYQAAQTIYGYAKAVKADNQFIVLNTELHFDHIGGNSFFAELGIDIIGHQKIERTNKEFKEFLDNYNKGIINESRRINSEGGIVFSKTKMVNPNIKITDDFTIDLGGIEVSVFLTPGHTPANISAFLASEKILFCGDLYVSGYIPYLEEGNTIAWMMWIKSIERVSRYNPEIIIPGHGDIIYSNKIAFETKRLKHILEQAINIGKAPTL